MNSAMITILVLGLLPQAAEPSPADRYQRAMGAIEAADWDAAIADLSAVLEADPSHMPSKFYLAVSFNGSGRTDRAIETYREILAQDATVFEARMNLGVLLAENGSEDEAVEEFRLAMELAPDDPAPALYRAQVLGQSDRVDEAIDAYRLVLERADAGTETLMEAYRRLGSLLIRDDEPAAAEEMLAEAVGLGLEDPSVFVALGDLRLAADDPEGARTHYERALVLDADNADIELRLALVLRDSGLPGEAIRLIADRDDVDELLADTYAAAGRFDEAIPIYGRLADDEPENADHWYGLGRSHYETGDAEQAVPALERAVRLDAARHEAWGVLAAIHHRREDWATAGDMLLRYLEIRPDHAPSIFLLATCYDNLGDAEQALLHYNRFISLDDGSDDARSFQVRQRVQALEGILETR